MGAASNTRAANTPCGFWRTASTLPKGDSIRTGYSKTVVSWGLAAGRILGLLRGRDLSLRRRTGAGPGQGAARSDGRASDDRPRPERRKAADRACSRRLWPSTTSTRATRNWTRTWSRSQRQRVDCKRWQQEYHAFLDAYAVIRTSCVSACQRITPTGSVLCWTVCPTRSGTLTPSPISCANAKCSSRRTRLTSTF